MVLQRRHKKKHNSKELCRDHSIAENRRDWKIDNGNHLSQYNDSLQIIIQCASTCLCEKGFSSLTLGLKK